MKRCLCVFFMLFMVFGTQPAYAAPLVSAPCAALIDSTSGMLLYGKNENTRAYPASTTKVMTAILAIENGNFDDIVTVSFNAVNSISYDSSKAGWFEGEVVSYKDLVYSLLICSANDSANVIAEHTAGSIAGFVEKMNARAAELGAKNTHFVNAHGLHHEDHYTTAQDMAILARHAMTLPVFREIVAMRTYTIEPTNKSTEKRYLNSTNHLLNPNSPYYHAPAIGIKTGYTDNAHSCLVSASAKDGATYIAVVLGALSEGGQNMSFVDSRTLLSYGEKYCAANKMVSKGDSLGTIPVKNAKKMKDMPVHAAADVAIVLPENVTTEVVDVREYIKMDLEAPVSEGDIIGRMEYWYGDVLLGQTYMAADIACEKESVFVRLFSRLFSGVGIVLLVILLLFIFFHGQIRKMRVRRERRARAEMRRRNQY